MTACSSCSEIDGHLIYSLFDNILKKNGISKNLFLNIFIYQDDDFVILPMIGQMVEGYLLIIPIDHYMIYAHLDLKLYGKLQRLKDSISRILGETYGQPIFFEHGPMSHSMRAGCCSDHAHIHAVPISANVSDEFFNRGFDVRIVNNLADLKLQFERNQPYLYYENQQGHTIVMDVPNVPSQFIRRLIAERLDWGNKWD